MTAVPVRKGAFVSYSHEDYEWLQRLMTFLAPVLRDESFVVWDDRQIKPGEQWEGEIFRALDSARAAILLVSANFLASDYIARKELPAIMARANTDLTVLWIPVEPSSWEYTPLKNFQAAHDPQQPLSLLTKPKRDLAFTGIARKIRAAFDVSALAQALKIIDTFEPQVSAFVQGQPEPESPVEHSVRAEQAQSADQSSIQLVTPDSRSPLITSSDLEKLDENAQKLIRAYEGSMQTLFDRWTQLKPQRAAADPTIRDPARTESDVILRDLCSDLNQVLSFIESLGFSLQDHYQHVRSICAMRAGAA